MEQDLRSYIRTPIAVRILAILSVALMILGFAMAAAAAGNKESAADAVPFHPVETEQGAYAYVDIVAVSDWVVDDDNTIYYTVLDKEGYLYVAELSKSQFRELAAYNEYWNTEDDAVPAPEPYRLYGMVFSLGGEIKKNFAEAWDLSEEDFDGYFGTLFLNATTSPSQNTGAMWSLLGMFSLCMTLIYGILVISNATTARKCLSKLEADGTLTDAEQEFSAETTERYQNDKARFGANFVFGRHAGAALRYTDILWAYRRVTRVYFVPVGEALVVHTAERKLVLFTDKSHRDADAESDVGRALGAIAERNPDALLGYTPENRKAYSAAAKERRSQQ